MGPIFSGFIAVLISLFVLASQINCDSIVANGKENLNASSDLICKGVFPEAHDSAPLPGIKSEPACPTFVWTSIDVTQPYVQGDAHLLEPPDGTKILVDAGSAQGAPKLIKFLSERKIKRLHKVLITHPHFDHLEGIVPLLQAGIQIDEFYLNFYPPILWDTGATPQMISKVQETLKHFKIEVRPITPGLILYHNMKEKLKIEVLYQFTPENIPTAKPNLNDLSSLVMIAHHRLKFLLTGDILSAMGDWYANQGNLAADVLKVPHHGAGPIPPPSFYTAVGAKTFIITAPVALWENKQRCATLYQVLQADPSIKTLVNGLEGNIRISSNGYTFQIN